MMTELTARLFFLKISIVFKSCTTEFQELESRRKQQVDYLLRKQILEWLIIFNKPDLV